jgi:hypothetical protein
MALLLTRAPTDSAARALHLPRVLLLFLALLTGFSLLLGLTLPTLLSATLEYSSQGSVGGSIAALGAMAAGLVLAPFVGAILAGLTVFLRLRKELAMHGGAA